MYIYIYIHIYILYIFISLYILLSQNSWQDQSQYLITRKNALFLLLGIYLLYNISYLLWMLGRIWYVFHKLIFQFLLCLYTNESRASANNIVIKVSALPLRWPLFSDIVLPILEQI